MGAGVPCPVHPKSQLHRNATAKPRIEGTVAIQRHRAVSTWKPNHGGSNQNHRAKKAVPTANEANAAGQCEPRGGTGAVPVCSLVTTASTTPKYAPTAQPQQQKSLHRRALQFVQMRGEAATPSSAAFSVQPFRGLHPGVTADGRAWVTSKSMRSGARSDWILRSVALIYNRVSESRNFFRG